MAAPRASAPRRSCWRKHSAPQVVTTAGSDEKCAAAKKIGADVTVNYKTAGLRRRHQDATGGKGANLIVDIVGGDYIDRNYAAAADQGVIAQVSVHRAEGHGELSRC